MPFFSVIIAAYNRENLIAATLESVLAQQYTDYEIIVVDDGSADATAEIVRRHTNVRLICQENQGAGAARNRGTNECSGEYLAFLDSDDLWFPWTLAIYARVIQENARPAFIAGKPVIFSGATPPTTERAEPEFINFADYFRSSDEWRWWGASSFVIRRNVFLETGGFVSGELSRRINGEDCDLTMKLGVAPGFVQVLAPPTFAYREHQANIRKNPDKSINTASLLIDKESAGNYPGRGERQPQRREILSRHVRPIILLCLQAGRDRDAWRMYRQTFWWHVRLGRVRFLAAFVATAAVASLGIGRVHAGLGKHSTPGR